MNIFSVVIASLLGLLVLAFSLLLFLAIVFNLNAGKKYRQSLARELEKLRLNKMLSALGVDVNTYLHSERIADIQQQMNRCSGCSQTAECDDRLSEGRIGAADIGFCNNEQALQDMVEKQKHASSTSN